jgi:hypothetical protein
LQKLQRRLRRAAAPCGCHCVVPTNVALPSLSHLSRAFAASTAVASSSHRSAHQLVMANSSRTATFNNHQDDEEAEDDNANQPQEYDEIGTSQLQDAPCATQPTPRHRRPLLITCQALTHLAGVRDGLRGTDTCFSVADHPLMCF